MKVIRALLFVFLAILVLAFAWFINWASHPLPAAPEALAALQDDEKVDIFETSQYISFLPTNPKLDVYTGFIFYPGAHVDPRAYAAPLREIAAHGYYVVLVKMPLNMAIIDINSADRVYDTSSDLQWVIGGHSLGGVAAAMHTRSDSSKTIGLILWGAFVNDKGFQNLGIPVLSIYGTRDFTGLETFENARAFLPPDTQFLVIEGGNHSQFGDYGLQPGDNQATISRADQQAQTIQAVIEFLRSIELGLH